MLQPLGYYITQMAYLTVKTNSLLQNLPEAKVKGNALPFFAVQEAGDGDGHHLVPALTLLQDIVKCSGYDTVESYLDNMSKEGIWGDGSILSAAALLYKRQIVIYYGQPTSISIPCTSLCDNFANMGIIRLGYVNNNHYTSLISCGLPVESNLELNPLEKAQSSLSVNLISPRPRDASNSTKTKIGPPPDPPQNIVSNLDIGHYFHYNISGESIVVSDDMKVKLLEQHWQPGHDYPMPFSTRTVQGKPEKRFLRIDHLNKCPYAVYSHVKQGLFCKYCALFANESKSKHGQALGFLVTKPLTKYDQLFGKNGYLTQHEQTQYHKTAVVRASQFCSNYKKGESIITCLDSGLRQQVEENRNRLKPIVKTVILCGRQNFALRGHRDDGLVLTSRDYEPCEQVNDALVASNSSNFRALLNFRVDAGDTILEEHLLQSAHNATYVSKTTQNDLIESCGNVIRQKISDNVHKAKYFTVLADETTDVSRVEQLTIILRYVSHRSGTSVVVEDFVGFQPVADLTGEGIANKILNFVRNLGLDMTYMVGQGYDGASSMSGKFNGTQAIIRQQFPNAIYVHCASHALNLVISKSCQVQAIRNCQGVISEVANFVNRSAKRVAILKTAIEQLEGRQTNRTRILRLCETRWVERHDAVLSFKLLYEGILQCLVTCQGMHDAETSSKARMYLKAITDSDFIVALSVLDKILAYSLSLSISLQTVNTDLLQALSSVSNLLEILKQKRTDADETFSHIWITAEELAGFAGCELQTPRLVGRQCHRSNVPAASPLEYYRRTVYIPFIDSMITQLETKFAGHNSSVYHITNVVPAFLLSRSVDDVKPALELYVDFIDSQNVVLAELELWKQKWLSVSTSTVPSIIPSTAIDALNSCQKSIFPNVYTLLTIACTLPVTTASAERSFSSLRRLKTYLRSTMSAERLSGLSLLYVHPQVTITPDEVIDDFAKAPRRQAFKI